MATAKCKEILDELDPLQFEKLAWETGIDMVDFLDNYESNDEDKNAMLSHFIQSTAHFLRPSENRKMRRVCRRLVLALAELGDAEDMILHLIEEIEFEEEADTKEIIVLIDACKIPLKRFHKKDHKPIEWVLTAFLRFINNQINVPDHNLEGNEKLLLDSDSDAIVIDSLYTKLIDFSEFIFEQVLPNLNVSPEGQLEFRNSFLFFLIKILGKPIAYMDLEVHKIEDKSTSESKSSTANNLSGHNNAEPINDLKKNNIDNTNLTSKSIYRVHCENIVSLILRLNSNLLKFVNCTDCRAEYGDLVIDSDYTHLSLGVLYYLIFHERVSFDSIPKIYSNTYIFINLLEKILCLLQISSNLVQRKGLLLSLSLLNNFQPYELDKKSINSSELSKFSDVLPGIMVFSESKENRQLALEVFKKFINSLNSLGRYTVLLYLPRKNNNSGFIGYLTTIVKDLVFNYLNNSNSDKELFSGKKLNDILKNLVKLNEGVETDIAENSDRIISVLNFLRFLIIRDKNNETGIVGCLKWIQNDFLTPLEKAVELSKAHYELEMKNNEKSDNDAPVSVSVGGQTLPNLSRTEKQNILLNAMNTFDLIDSLRARVVECIGNQ